MVLGGLMTRGQRRTHGGGGLMDLRVVHLKSPDVEIKGSADANGGKHVMTHPELLIAALTPGQRQ